MFKRSKKKSDPKDNNAVLIEENNDLLKSIETDEDLVILPDTDFDAQEETPDITVDSDEVITVEENIEEKTEEEDNDLIITDDSNDSDSDVEELNVVDTDLSFSEDKTEIDNKEEINEKEVEESTDLELWFDLDDDSQEDNKEEDKKEDNLDEEIDFWLWKVEEDSPIMWWDDSNDDEQLDVILAWTIWKLEKRQENIKEIKKWKSDQKKSLQEQIDKLQFELKDIEAEVVTLDKESRKITTNIKWLEGMKLWEGDNNLKKK